MRRWEGKPQTQLPKRGQNKFSVIIGVEIAYMLMERARKLVTLHEERWSVCIEQT